MPVVLWPWPGGSLLKAQRGAAPLASANWGYWAVCWAVRMNSWKVGGQWGPAGATEVTTIENLGCRLKGTGVKEDHASGAEKELLFPPVVSQRTQPRSQPSRRSLSQTTAPSFSCHVITFSVFLCTATGIITFVLRRRNNIWCLFLINQAVSVHISHAVAGDI